MQGWHTHGTPAALPAARPTADVTNGFRHASPSNWDMASETFTSQPLATWHLGENLRKGGGAPKPGWGPQEKGLKLWV